MLSESKNWVVSLTGSADEFMRRSVNASLLEALPGSLARLLPGYPQDEEPIGAAAPELAAQAAGSYGVRITVFKLAFFALTGALLLLVLLSLAAPEAAYAQQQGGGGGGGGAIQGAIDAARDWLASIMVSLGGLGFIASVAIKAVARTNENMHHAAHMGMGGSALAVAAGLLVNDIIDLVASFAGGGGNS